MKIALITDTHYGVRNDNVVFMDNTKKFLDEVFFKYIDENNIRHCIHLGDVVDRRKYINIYTASRLREDFLKPLDQRGILTLILCGNHDTYYKNTNEVNSLQELIKSKYKNIRYLTNAENVTYSDGTEILMVPWICEENRNDTMDKINTSKAQICFGHLELEGFCMYKGSIISHGDDRNLYNRFDVVCSGHFHHRSNDGHVFYLGSHGEFTWSDYDDERGFHVFDTETRKLEFIKNPYTMFEKIWYDDLNKTSKEVLDIDFSQYNSKILKVIITNKTNPAWFDKFIENIENNNCVDLQIVDDHFNLNLQEDDSLVSEAESTIDIFKKYITQSEFDCDKTKLTFEIEQLYKEALSVE